MDIQRCFEILEIDPDAGADDAKQAYRDLVNIWHPDRFSSNPRLQKKSEEKLKEINIAYETVRNVLSSPKSGSPASGQQTKSREKTEPETGRRPDSQPKNHKTGTPDKTEAFVEAGTGLVLNLFSAIYSAVRHMVTDAVTEITSETSAPPRQNTAYGKNCRRKGPGKGNGMGNGGGGRRQGRR